MAYNLDPSNPANAALLKALEDKEKTKSNLLRPFDNVVAAVNSVNPLMWGANLASNLMDKDVDGVKGALSKTYKDQGKLAKQGVTPVLKDLAGLAVDGADLAETAWVGRKEMDRRRQESQPTPSPEQKAVTPGQNKNPMFNSVPLQSLTESARKNVIQSEIQLNKGFDQNVLNEVGVMSENGYSPKQISDTLDKLQGNMSPQTYLAAKKHIEGLAKQSPFAVVQDAQIQQVQQNVKNKAEGKGDATGYVAPPDVTNLKEEGALTKSVVDSASQNLVNQARTPINWYESDSFNRGLITFGLGLLSGQDYATAFGNASSQFDAQFAQEQRQTFRDELLAEGYTEPQIMEWVTSNNASVLQKPKVQERWSTGSDSYGAYQQSSLTGKRDYMPRNTPQTTWRDATRNMDGQIVYGQESSLGQFHPYNLPRGEGSGGSGGRGAGGSGGVKGNVPRDIMASTFSAGYDEAAAEDPTVYSNKTGLTVAEGASSLMGTFGERATSRGFFGDDARTYKTGMESRRQFIEHPLRLVTGAVIAKGEEDPWMNRLFTMSKEERENGISENKRRMRNIILTQANAITLGDTAYTIPQPHVKLLAEGRALPLRDSRTGVVLGIQFEDGERQMYRPMSAEEIEARKRTIEGGNK